MKYIASIRVLITCSVMGLLLSNCGNEIQRSPGNEFISTGMDQRVRLNNETLVEDSVVQSIGQFAVSKSFAQDNLQVFLISNNEPTKDKAYVTLTKAMEDKKAVVNETGNVGELSIDNNSDDYIFIHSGDIVKGGKQDRAMAYDVIVPPNTKNVPLNSFCVEQSRWTGRGGESTKNFNGNTMMLSSTKLKRAAKYEANQSRVWEKVSEQQNDLNKKVSVMNGYKVDVTENASKTSLQLALESKELEKAKKDLEEKLHTFLEGSDNAIGYAYAINGEIYGADIYGSKVLFRDLWKKLSSSVITESISERDSSEFQQVTKKDVANYILSYDKAEGKTKAKELNKTTNFYTKEGKDLSIVFTTEDADIGTWVHKNYMKQDTTVQNSLIAPQNR